MDSDWDTTESKVSSLHIPIDQEAKKAYDEWVEDDCNYLWWYNKEKRKELINVGYIID